MFYDSDVKIPYGNNRQFDLLALKYESKFPQLYHIEIGVTHDENWTVGLDQLKEIFKCKFYGNPRQKDTTSNKTDRAKGKSYLQQISDVYENYGFKYEDVVRVYCLWYLKFSNDEYNKWREEIAKDLKINENKITLLSIRDKVLPELIEKIKTNNYDDDLLRTLSLLKQFEFQTSKSYKKLSSHSNIERFFGIASDSLNSNKIDDVIYEN